MDVFKRLGWFFVPFLLILLGLAGCTVTERIQYRRYSSNPPGVWYYEERVVETDEGVILERTSDFNPREFANVAFAWAGTLVQGAGRLADGVLTLFGLGDLIASTEPSVRPLPPVRAAP